MHSSAPPAPLGLQNSIVPPRGILVNVEAEHLLKGDDVPTGHRGRLVEIDALRGLAALVVLIHHVLLFGGALTGPFGQWLGASPFQSLRTGRPAVLFFFVLSGFVLARAFVGEGARVTGRRWAVWGARRIVRLGVPVAASVVISAALYALLFDGDWPGKERWFAATVWQSPPTAMAIAFQSSLLPLDDGYPLNSVLWSLVHEMRFSLVLPGIFILCQMVPGGPPALALLAVGLAGMAMGPLGATTYLGADALGTLRASLYFGLPFVAGVAMAMGGAAEYRADWWTRVTAGIAVLGLARVGSDLGTVAASVLIVWLALQPGFFQQLLNNQAVVWLGTVSFSLYLIHVPIIAALHHGLHDQFPVGGISVIAFAASLTSAWLFHRAIERPAHALARTLRA